MTEIISKIRVQIVDYNPLVHSYLFGGAPRLSKTLNINGQPTTIDTTIQNYTIKAIHRWSKNGLYPTAVCFDSPCHCRKTYFKQLNQRDKNNEVVEYKGVRDKLPSQAFDGINMTAGLMRQAGVSIYKADNYESDDLIKACVDKAKEQYAPHNMAREKFYLEKVQALFPSATSFDIKPVLGCLFNVKTVDRPLEDYIARLAKLFHGISPELLNFATNLVLGASEQDKDILASYIQDTKGRYPIVPIDIICNDADLLPLVDDQVSVFFRTKKMAWAETKELLKPKYIQVTPANFQEVVEGISSYKNLIVPYNTILLAKLLRGDKSDNVLGHPSWTPREYKKLVEILVDNVEDLAGIFRYGGEEQLALITNMLSNYIDDEDIEHIQRVYRGINLNGGFTGLPNNLDRVPATITSPILGYEAGKLQHSVSPLGIRLDV